MHLSKYNSMQIEASVVGVNGKGFARARARVYRLASLSEANG